MKGVKNMTKDILLKDWIFYDEFEEALQLFHSIREAHKDGDTDELVKTMINSAVDYVSLRAKWSILSDEEIVRMDSTRSQYHDLLILSLDKLAGDMTEKGRDTEWRKQLGDDRKRIGDFASYITCIQGISNR